MIIMYPTISQFSNSFSHPIKPAPKPKFKSSGGDNPYKVVDQFLDYQIKQARLSKLQDKNGKV